MSERLSRSQLACTATQAHAVLAPALSLRTGDSATRDMPSRFATAVMDSPRRTIRTYEYQDAATLLADFWDAVDAVLRERGVIP